MFSKQNFEEWNCSSKLDILCETLTMVACESLDACTPTSTTRSDTSLSDASLGSSSKGWMVLTLGNFWHLAWLTVVLT